MSEQSERQERGLMIAAKTRITQKDGVWHVPSASNYAPFYTVNPDPAKPHCTCPDFEKREAKCKHIYAVEIVVERESSTTTTTDGETTTTTTTEVVKVTKRVTYGQDWTAYVETVFSMIKAKFSTRLRSKGDTAQINEALCKVLCHNLCVLIQSMFELEIVPTFCGEIAVGQ